MFHLSDAPGPLNVYTLGGLIWVLTTFYYPYAFITISRAMEKMDPSLEEASRISGVSPGDIAVLMVFLARRDLEARRANGPSPLPASSEGGVS